MIDGADVDALYAGADDAERLLKLLANRHRLVMICFMGSDEATVGDLVTASGLSQSNVSQHLAVLRDAKIVASRAEGQLRIYRLIDPAAAALVRTLCEVFHVREATRVVRRKKTV